MPHPRQQPRAQQRFEQLQDEQDDNSGTQLQDKIVGVEWAEGKEMPRKWPKQREREDDVDSGKNVQVPARALLCWIYSAGNLMWINQQAEDPLQ